VHVETVIKLCDQEYPIHHRLMDGYRLEAELDLSSLTDYEKRLFRRRSMVWIQLAVGLGIFSVFLGLTIIQVLTVPVHRLARNPDVIFLGPLILSLFIVSVAEHKLQHLKTIRRLVDVRRSEHGESALKNQE